MTPQPTLEPLRRWDPERIGPYLLLGRLGAGAMGQVYLGRSTAGRLVAVKTIKIELAEEAGFRTRFAYEVAAARRVSGVFTAAVVAADPEADVPWLATAYVPAPSLSRLVRACGPFPVPAARWLAAGCAEALESIHGAGLVHRDLKPSNVLVSPDGPRVIDFGVARAAERISLTVTRGAVGTPAYMAPEQARDTRQASVASDVFSLGATLLFAVTGHPPYGGETVMDVLVRLATEPPDLRGLPAGLADLIGGCLERSPRKRPTSAALLAQLGPFVDATPAPGGGHPYLTAPAAALIAGYQRGPQTGAFTRTADDADEDTFGSHTALPAPRTSRGRGLRLPRRLGTGRPVPAAPRREARREAGGRSRLLPAAALAGAGVVLLGAGAIAGESFGADASPAATSSPAGQGLPPPPVLALPPGSSATPAVQVLQPQGDGNTVFLIHGSGWPPLASITVALAGHGISAVRPVVDRVGTFNYAIDQGHKFFPRQIPVGSYQVVVTGPGGRRATARFRVVPQPPPGPARPSTPPR